ncbi:cytochrome c biogenesis protein ResB [Haloechinothrix sp. LS1_15]|uniref:cytochrome c biogenesis protein ResB n=1 Tax=Haloechinothrix sp. LS1_15 TaxID=2652248 RepID=UPI0029482FF1|nr:cytochrome c biogenesis protein ResB [Haloechinothrix sp. LS1_15]MDV6012642.1 cytochrome c biogenesis protein ResB [Haloechinothrix sp. LS1_15]
MTGQHTGADAGQRYRGTPARRVLALARNTWRGLTSMRVALILLFLLAVAAFPGAVLPQRMVNDALVAEYIADHGWWGRLLDRLQFFDVYGSVWFSAIYLLLLVSLVGCLVPRSAEYLRSMRDRPVLTPRNLRRLPHYRQATLDVDADEVIARASTRLTGWRRVERTEPDGSRTISAERGYLRETGNLVFHFALLGLIIAFAVGHMYSYEGQVIVHADGSEFCNSGIYAYDTFNPGLTVDGTELTPFCVKVNDFEADYLPNGQPENYRADIEYQSGEDLDTGTWRPYELQVNHPLRTEGDRVYLLGHGFAPEFTVTFPDGQQRRQATQWRPNDQVTLLSDGATKFDPPGVTDATERRSNQIAVTGLFAPTAHFDGAVLSSANADLLDPAVAVDVMRGDLGIDSGYGQSIFEIDENMVEQGKLERVARENLRLGEELELDDGTRIAFDGVQRWASLQVSHDPTQQWVLAFSIVMLAGLAASLTIKRRRIWIRVTPDGGTRSVVALGGLARTDQAGYGEEFTRIATELLGDAERPAHDGTEGERS